ncbi:MAG TPA: sigma-70 family RNA polymerase sigma factor, partial [Gemmataceae bacterium]|nr:sigma-70 family RNA polymerase sigma factor [Gemmataceae bacterium]
MRTSPINKVIEHLRRAVLLPDGAGLGDGELLGSFIECHDETALTALVKRHGPMVWCVCRRLLSHHDAEDAFQATFLVLVRKAASVVPRDMVGNWLYGVAHQTALLAQRTAARRRAREVQVTEMPDIKAVQQDQWPELRPLLDEELSRLPEIYRAVIVLCDLEGRSRKETARQIGVPEGTVAGRLARARALLAKRLLQRGVTLSCGALAAILLQNVVSAASPASVVSKTIKVASLLAAGQAAGAISVKVAALTEGVLKAMLVSNLKTATAALLVVVALVCGAATGMICRTQAGEPQKAEKPAEQKAEAEAGKKAKTDVERLQGKWQIVSMGESGKEEKLEGIQEADVTFKGDTVRMRFDVSNVANPNFTTAYARYRLDTSAKPKAIQMIDGTAEELFNIEEVDRKFADADEQTQGIYAFDGDTLRLCFSTP